MTTTAKVATHEVKIGQTVKGNLIAGNHEVTEIRTRGSQMRNASTEYSFYNASGEEFFIGRTNSKATLS
jgi:hypothetical protein